MKNIIEDIRREYEEFARGSKVTVKKEGEGYRLQEVLENGDAGITIYIGDDFKKEGIVFNHGWKLEANDAEYLGEACDKVIKLLEKYGVPLGKGNTNLVIKSKSYRLK